MPRSGAGLEVTERVANTSDTAATRALSLVAAGDATVNVLMQTGVALAARSPRADLSSLHTSDGMTVLDWQRQRGVRFDAREGGALLLARQLEFANHGNDFPTRVVSYAGGDLNTKSPAEILRFVAEVAELPESGATHKPPFATRIVRSLGYIAPDNGAPEPLSLPNDDPDADIVILEDNGNGFRSKRNVWPSAITQSDATPRVIFNMTKPIAKGPLFEHLIEAHADRLILVVEADDVRAAGIAISRRLSWERTARDFLWHMQNNPELHVLSTLPNVIVRFGVEAAIHYSSSDEQSSARLYYDPLIAEAAFVERCRGNMPGISTAFVAALTARVAREGANGIREGIRDGIRSSRRLLRLGFRRTTNGLDFPASEVFAAAREDDDAIVDVQIPPSPGADSADPDFWSILANVETGGLEQIAHDLVASGETSALRNVPVGEFGALRTVDRSEIESFRSIQNVIGEYLGRPHPKRPLCLAVFGPPGSGKSFGVEQVAKSVGQTSDAQVVKLEFNLSQFESTRDLIAAFHRVRDNVLEGKIPLVFFDEFDCHFNGPLGWLRYFLAPMQDGVFRDGESVHPIGKSIFVFAGGLSSTFSQFSRESMADDLSPADRQAELKLFRETKGPDFVSRLRGHVNILGPNPNPATPGERLYLIRRATVLRSLLQRNWPNLVDPQERNLINIDPAVLRALISTPRYKHGIRSLESVLEMSMLEGRSVFEAAALPALEQLEQHVDAAGFARLVLQGVIFTAARDAIARTIHEKYRSDHASDRSATDPAMQSWDTLGEVFKRSNRAQAADILRKLERVKCSYRPRTDNTLSDFHFTPNEIELLAELEHERWMQEKLDSGFSYGPTRDPQRKTHPCLVDWPDLSEAARQDDRDAVQGIPQFMSEAGFEVYRL